MYSHTLGGARVTPAARGQASVVATRDLAAVKLVRLHGHPV